jgi:nucleotide-binding universal stress UspA family protein
VPLLVCGPKARPSPDGYQRLVVAVNGAQPRQELVCAAASLARRLGVEVVFTQVVTSASAPGWCKGWPADQARDVHESAYLHRVAEAANCKDSSFDTLHADRVVDGILSFVGDARTTITMVGAPALRHHHLRPAGPVTRAVIKSSTGPVVIVPVHPSISR